MNTEQLPADLIAPWNNGKGRKPYKWNVYPMPIEDHRLVRRLRPTWSKDRFLAERDAALKVCHELSLQASNAWNEAFNKHGSSGAYYGSRGWDSWPVEVRNTVGELHVNRCRWHDLAMAYHRCAGKMKSTLPAPY